MQKRSNKFMIGAIVGGTVGALTSLLFNTNEGKKIQKRLMKKFHEMNKKASHFGISTFTDKKKTALKPRKRKSQRVR